MGPDPDRAELEWLRSAFTAQNKQIVELRGVLDRLRRLYLDAVPGPLTVPAAELCRVCRICRQSTAVPRTGMLYAYGGEYAHVSCLKAGGGVTKGDDQ